MNTETNIVLRSVTHSVKAKKLLSRNGIGSRLIKPPSHDGKGCTYGIALASTLADAAAGILIDNGIPILKIIRE